MQSVTLANGVRMPQIGFGVYQISKEDCVRCVSEALETGYRSFDTAQSYMNEAEVGRAVGASGIPRQEIFITTKVWLEFYSYDKCRDSVYRSLDRLGTDYLDLVLLHQPYCDYHAAYRALEDLYDHKIIRAVGVSNFFPDRLVDLALTARIRPQVNQIETHPHYQQQEAVDWMKKYQVQPEAWAPFGEGRNGLFENGILSSIASAYGKSAAQVMLRWQLQRGVVVIPKSVHKARMQENFAVFDFELTDSDMMQIAGLDKGVSSLFDHRDPGIVQWMHQAIRDRHGKI